MFEGHFCASAGGGGGQREISNGFLWEGTWDIWGKVGMRDKPWELAAGMEGKAEELAAPAAVEGDFLLQRRVVIYSFE